MKGDAVHYRVSVADGGNADVAGSYPEPKPEASRIRDDVAFWNGVRIEVA